MNQVRIIVGHSEHAHELASEFLQEAGVPSEAVIAMVDAHSAMLVADVDSKQAATLHTTMLSQMLTDTMEIKFGPR